MSTSSTFVRALSDSRYSVPQSAHLNNTFEDDVAGTVSKATSGSTGRCSFESTSHARGDPDFRSGAEYTLKSKQPSQTCFPKYTAPLTERR
eukprot:CAMPEP_0174841390 /NCGR_PEP_ID=MMETSP1114-20130205/9283_1 /TAXON_ID=312471 /ORGANISM="Neobodo designis, Strain CCAP 1951/1" /LENGTH=90 /DNA_ID=CAMNT_0016075571 /DNA_START=153 /DNA_END=426 /DNA_ORIENTATION=-